MTATTSDRNWITWAEAEQLIAPPKANAAFDEDFCYLVDNGFYAAYKRTEAGYLAMTSAEVFAYEGDVETLFFDRDELLAGVQPPPDAPKCKKTTPVMYYDGWFDLPNRADSYPVYIENGEPAFDEFMTRDHVLQYRNDGGELTGNHITKEQARRLQILLNNY